MKRVTGRRGRALAMGLIVAGMMAGPLAAQTIGNDGPPPETNLDIPQNLQIFGKIDPNIRKPTALVNGVVITGSDVDQRMAMISAFNNLDIPPDQRDQVRLTVLRQLIDEVLEIEDAKTNEVTISSDDVDQSYARIAKQFNKTPDQFGAYLASIGASRRTMRQQIEADMAWQRYLRRKVEPETNVSEEEVKATIAALEAAKGTPEYHLKEIFKRVTDDGQKQAVFAAMQQLLKELEQGKAPFDYYAKTYSDATTGQVGGDLDWVRASALPAPLAQAVNDMQVGQVGGPIEVEGGFSIIYLEDKRRVLVADPRDARLSLKQLTIRFPPGLTQAQAEARAAAFGSSLKALAGCGSVEKVAGQIGADVIGNDDIAVRDLPPQLQAIMLKLQVGQATPPFGSPQEGVRSLVLCGREDPVDNGAPTVSQVEDRMTQTRVNLRAQQMLRDLRRDAIIEYR